MTQLTVPPDSEPARKEILGAYARLTELGFLVGTWGNVSLRVAEGLLVTPSRVPLEEMTLDDLVLVSLAGRKLKGRRLPSSEMHLHRLLLAARPDIGALVHTHSVHASAVSCLHRPLPVLLEDMSQIIGGEVACTEYVPAGRHEELGAEAARKIGPKAMAVLLANHGPVVGGRTLAEACVAAQVLEKAAYSYIVSIMAGGSVPIPAVSVDSERDRFLYKYGTVTDAGPS